MNTTMNETTLKSAEAITGGATPSNLRRGPAWSVADSRELYHVQAWGQG